MPRRPRKTQNNATTTTTPVHPNGKSLISIGEVNKVWKFKATPSLQAFTWVTPGVPRPIENSTMVTPQHVRAAVKAQKEVKQLKARTAERLKARSVGKAPLSEPTSQHRIAVQPPSLPLVSATPVTPAAAATASTAAVHPNGQSLIRIGEASGVYRFSATPSLRAFKQVPGLPKSIDNSSTVTAEQVQAAVEAQKNVKKPKPSAQARSAGTGRSTFGRASWPAPRILDEDSEDDSDSDEGSMGPNSSPDVEYDSDDAEGILYDIDTQWGMLPNGGAYKESNHYMNGILVG